MPQGFAIFETWDSTGRAPTQRTFRCAGPLGNCETSRAFPTRRWFLRSVETTEPSLAHLVKPPLAFQKSPNPFRFLSLHGLYVHIRIPKFILFAHYSPGNSPLGFAMGGPLDQLYVHSSMHNVPRGTLLRPKRRDSRILHPRLHPLEAARPLSETVRKATPRPPH